MRCACARPTLRVMQNRIYASIRYYSTQPLITTETLVIGGGAVGLAVAYELSKSTQQQTHFKPDQKLIVAEKHAWVGFETSSRNSEVIHASLYYPDQSLKTRLCLQGKHLLYDFCKRHHVPVKRIGKWVVALTSGQQEYLMNLKQKAQRLDIPLEWVSSRDTKVMEPSLKAVAALSSPTTGIIDSHTYLKTLEHLITENGGLVALNSVVQEIYYDGKCYNVLLIQHGIPITIRCKYVVNSAGLFADKVALMLGLTHAFNQPHETYRLHYCKGHYVSYQKKGNIVQRLIYPCPDKHLESLGIHSTLDLTGKLKFGPDTLYIDQIDYSMPTGKEAEKMLDKFYSVISTYLPSIQREGLALDYCGIRPKLAAKGEPFRDFIIQEESQQGYPGFINLIGIESPGLTSSLAIGVHVARLLHEK